MSSDVKLRSTRALKARVEYIVVAALMTPNLVWIALDRTVWSWDAAFYGKGSVELFLTLIRSTGGWRQAMLGALAGHAPGIAWIGQFFVPLGFLLGSVDRGLLVSVLATQAVTLFLVYKSVSELTGQNRVFGITGCLVTASAPLFVAMSHQYYTEPLQLMAVSWFVAIGSFAPRWDRGFIVGHLVLASSVAMLAKVTSPLYCVGPGLIALWFVFRPMPAPENGHERSKTRVLMTLAAGVFLSASTGAWYYRNWAAVLKHAKMASAGPIAELYGARDSFLNTIAYWLGYAQKSFFLPVTLIIIFAVFVGGVWRYSLNSESRNKHPAICAGVWALQLVMVLSAFSLSSNRETRYLLPALPYVACLISWSIAQVSEPLVTAVLIITCLIQLAAVHGQALGILSRNLQISSWLAAADTNTRTTVMVSSIVERTCKDDSPGPYWTIVGDQKAWLNFNTLGYTAAKELAPSSQQRCYYDDLGYMASDVDEVWEHVLRARPHYYITTDPRVYPVPDDTLDRTANQLNAPVLKKVVTSGLFEAEPPLPEEPGVLIFKRKPLARNDDAGAAAVSTESIDSVRGARFGQSFELLGASLTAAANGGVDLKLAWRCLRETRLKYDVAVHLLDDSSRLLAQADFAQDPEQELVRPGATWVDRVRLSSEQVKGARRVGIALYATGGGTVEPIDRGPLDWDGRRLLLPLDGRTRTKATP
jgi:hypothetical protein